MKYIISLFLLLTTLLAQDIAIVKNVKGDVSVQDGDTLRPIKDGNSLHDGMIIITKQESSVTIIFKDNSKLALGSNAMLNLEKFVFKPIEKEYDFQLFLEEGSMTFESGKIGELSPEDFILKTPDATVAIRGTKFFIKVP